MRKKLVLLAIAVASTLGANASILKVECCDGSVKYAQGMSLLVYLRETGDLQSTFLYADAFGADECPEGCYVSVDDYIIVW